MSLAKRYFWGVISGVGSLGLKTILNLTLTPLLLAKLGLGVFSLNTLLITILEIMLFLDLGVSNALINRVGTSQATEERKAYLKAAQVFFTVMSLLFLLAGMGASPWIPLMFHLDSHLLQLAQTGLPFVFLEAAITFYGTYYEAVLSAHCAHQWSNTADIQHALITGLGSLVLLLMGVDLIALIMLRTGSSLLRLAMLVFHSIRLEPDILRLKVPFERRRFMEMMRLAAHGATINLSVIVSHKLDAMIIALFLPIQAVGVYDLVFRMFGLVTQVCLKFSAGSFTLFSRMAASHQVADARQLFLCLSSLLALVVMLLVLMIGSYYFELFSLISAKRIPIEKTVAILWIAVPCTISGVLQIPARNWLFAWGHQAYLTRSSLLAAGVNLLLSLLLVPLFGIVGVGLGTLIPQLIQHQAGLIRTACRELKISWKEYLRVVHMGVFCPILSAWAWIQLWRFGLPRGAMQSIQWMSLVPIGLVASSGALIGVVIWFIWNASEWEKKVLSGFYRNRIRRFSQPVLKRQGLNREPLSP